MRNNALLSEQKTHYPLTSMMQFTSKYFYTENISVVLTKLHSAASQKIKIQATCLIQFKDAIISHTVHPRQFPYYVINADVMISLHHSLTKTEVCYSIPIPKSLTLADRTFKHCFKSHF